VEDYKYILYSHMFIHAHYQLCNDVISNMILPIRVVTNILYVLA